MLDSSSVTREMTSMNALVACGKLEFEVHRSRIILIERLRTLTPVSFIRSATFSKYWQEGQYMMRVKKVFKITIKKCKGITSPTFKPTSGWEAICLPTSSRAASRTDIAESQNLPSTADWIRISHKTSGSASTIKLT